MLGADGEALGCGRVSVPRLEHSIHEHHRQLPLVFHHELRVGREEVKDRDHCLARSFADPFSITFHQLETDGQGIVVLANGRECLGQLEFGLEVGWIGGEPGTGRLNAGNTGFSGLEPQSELSFHLLGVGFQKALAFQLG